MAILFKSVKDKMKYVVKEESQKFCDMLDCVDAPPALDYTVSVAGVKVRISVEED
jgi:hypothetical protein